MAQPAQPAARLLKVPDAFFHPDRAACFMGRKLQKRTQWRTRDGFRKFVREAEVWTRDARQTLASESNVTQKRAKVAHDVAR